jgi:hypothetical protein
MDDFRSFAMEGKRMRIRYKGKGSVTGEVYLGDESMGVLRYVISSPEDGRIEGIELDPDYKRFERLLLDIALKDLSSRVKGRIRVRAWPGIVFLLMGYNFKPDLSIGRIQEIFHPRNVIGLEKEADGYRILYRDDFVQVVPRGRISLRDRGTLGEHLAELKDGFLEGNVVLANVDYVVDGKELRFGEKGFSFAEYFSLEEADAEELLELCDVLGGRIGANNCSEMSWEEILREMGIKVDLVPSEELPLGCDIEIRGVGIRVDRDLPLMIALDRISSEMDVLFSGFFPSKVGGWRDKALAKKKKALFKIEKLLENRNYLRAARAVGAIRGDIPESQPGFEIEMQFTKELLFGDFRRAISDLLVDAFTIDIREKISLARGESR